MTTAPEGYPSADKPVEAMAQPPASPPPGGGSPLTVPMPEVPEDWQPGDPLPAPDLPVSTRSMTFADDQGRPTVQTVITGKGMDLLGQLGVEPPCEHRSPLAKTEIARLVDEDGTLVGFRAQLAVICGECSRHFG